MSPRPAERLKRLDPELAYELVRKHRTNRCGKRRLRVVGLLCRHCPGYHDRERLLLEAFYAPVVHEDGEPNRNAGFLRARQAMLRHLREQHGIRVRQFDNL